MPDRETDGFPSCQIIFFHCFDSFLGFGFFFCASSVNNSLKNYRRFDIWFVVIFSSVSKVILLFNDLGIAEKAITSSNCSIRNLLKIFCDGVLC